LSSQERCRGAASRFYRQSAADAIILFPSAGPRDREPVSPFLGQVTMGDRDTASFVYVANADSREILVLALDGGTGALSTVQRLALTGAVMPLAVSPDRRFLYAALRSEPFSAVSLRIEANGRLAHLSTVALPDSMAYVATDRTGRFLLSASYGGSKIAVNPIGPHGLVQEDPVQVMATPPNAHAIATDPSNRYVFTTCLGGDSVMQLRFDAATGVLTPNTPEGVAIAKGAGPRHFVFHPNNKFFYLINELDASLHVFSYDIARGLLSAIQQMTALPAGFAGKPWAADLHITPNGRFLYASERRSSTVTGFRVDGASGRLELLGSTATEEQPRGFAIDPRGRFLLAVGQASHNLTAYRIDAEGGALAPLGRHPMGQNPNWVEIVELP
jgi:6-phosphogluconolactonase